MIRSIILLVLSIFIISCGGETKKPIAKTETIPLKFENDLPPFPQADMMRLFEEGTYIDYIFYELPFSISQDDKPSIHANLKLISSLPLNNLPQGCKPIGREFFHIGGEIAYEADLYFTDNCIGYVFLKDQKPIYGSLVTEEGMKFYSNIIRQSTQISKEKGYAK